MPVEKEARKVAKKTEEELARMKNDAVRGAKDVERDVKRGAHDLMAKTKRKTKS